MNNKDIQETLERIEVLSGKELFFVVGVARSGTTWLQKALDSHDEIRCLGESHFMDMLLPRLQKSLQGFNKHVSQQGGVIAHLQEYGGHVSKLNFDSNDLYLLLYYCMFVVFDKWVDSGTIRFIGEKTPDNIRALNLLSTIFPHARFIHIRRDGRDCAVSGWFFNKSGMDADKVLAGSFEGYVARFLKQWKTEIDYATRVGSAIPDRYFELSFEDLVHDTTGSLGGVLRFLGASCNRDMVQTCVDSSTFEALSNGRPAGQEDANSFFRKGVAGDWRTHLTPELSERVWAIAGDTLKRLGYQRL